MAVTQQSDGNSKKPVEEGVEPSCGEGVDADSCGFVQLRNSDGLLTGPMDTKKDACGMIRSYKLRRNQCEDNKAHSLSDIDDAEVCGYLNTKEEMQYKRILWEAMNGKCKKAKKQKRTTETKKGLSAKKAAKTTNKPEFEERRSSRINYDALKILSDESERSSETAQIDGADSYVHRTVNSPHGNISYEMHGSNGGSYKDDQHDINYREDSGTFGHHEEEVYHEYGDEHFNDEYFDF